MADRIEDGGPAGTVKALDWVEHPAGGLQAVAAGIALYRVHRNGNDWYLGQDHMGTSSGTLAAQMHFEKCINSALTKPVSIGADRCFICNGAFVDGDIVLDDIEAGTGHRACFGEDREGYCNLDTGQPLAPDEPIPTGYNYRPASAPLASAEVSGRLPTCEEAAAAACVLLRCNGADLTDWDGDGLHDDNAQDALKGIAARARQIGLSVGSADHG